MGYKRFRFSRKTHSEANPLMATALHYERSQMKAPRVIASGKRKIAEQILAEAKKHNIPVYEDETLTQALSAINLGEEIPPELYPIVAQVLAYVYRVTSQKIE